MFHLIEALAAAGVAEGLPAALAMQLARATVCGAGELAHRAPETAAQLRVNVTSPGGTTQAAIDTFETGGLRTLVDAAIHAARVRGAALSAAND